MLVAFLWLTTGTFFLSVEQQRLVNNKTNSTSTTDDSEKASTPFENATEEKTETSSAGSFVEEYLREDAEHFLYAEIPLKHNKCHFEAAFAAIYGESVSQPPEIISC